MTATIPAAFEAIVPRLEKEAGGPVHLVRIHGARWAYVGGRIPDDMPCVVPRRVILNDSWALLFYVSSGQVIDEERIRLFFEEEQP